MVVVILNWTYGRDGERGSSKRLQSVAQGNQEVFRRRYLMLKESATEVRRKFEESSHVTLDHTYVYSTFDPTSISHSYSCWGLLRVSPTLTTLGNDHGFIGKGIHLHWYETFCEAQSKAMKAYAQSGQYHTIVESTDS